MRAPASRQRRRDIEVPGYFLIVRFRTSVNSGRTTTCRPLLPEGRPVRRTRVGPPRGVRSRAVDVEPEVNVSALSRWRDVDPIEIPDQVAQAVLPRHAFYPGAGDDRRT